MYKKISSATELYEIGFLNASEEELSKLSKERSLSLNNEELKLVKDYFTKEGRNPTDVEVEAIAQTWSEHCGHKTFKGDFEFNDDGARKEYRNIFKTFIAKATNEINAPWCFSVFEDNAGIVEFEGEYCISFKVETHNHPSALEPFGGAATGVGGVIRDTMGVWADPIAGTDVLCFAPLEMEEEKIPPGSKNPKFLFSGVVAGIASYGNNMGIPTVNGAIYFDESYAGNPLVFCGSVGLMKKGHYVKNTKAGDACLLVGGKTGRDGIHGVTMASVELGEKASEENRSAVQIGDPIEEEKTKRGILRVRDLKLASGITDLGGGGLSSAVSEMAHRSDCGIEVDLSLLPLKYPMDTPWELWISESQERMLLSVSKEKLEEVKEIFEEEEVNAIVIGFFDSSRRLVINYGKQKCADLDLEFLFTQPTRKKKAVWSKGKAVQPTFSTPDLKKTLLGILGMPNVCSKEKVVRKYDHEVKGFTAIKPFQGIEYDGPGDASVLKPLTDSWKGISISNGMNPEYGKIDAYWMAASAIDEAIRNNIAVGGQRIALLDNFSWGSPDREEQAGTLLKACEACYDFAVAFQTPFISGKDSLYNESVAGPITPSLLISAIGIVPDVRKCCTMDFKKEGSSILLVGETFEELGGSHYLKFLNEEGGKVPKVQAEKARANFKAVSSLIEKGMVLSCHDLSEGGLAVALAEMCFSGGMGASIDLNKINGMEDECVLFSESNSRFLIEVEKEKSGEVEKILSQCKHYWIGNTGGRELEVKRGKESILKEGIEELKNSWQSYL